MASVVGGFGRPSLLVCMLLAASGCGESFVATSGGEGGGGNGASGGTTSTAAGGGGSGAGASGGGGTTTTAPGECTDGEKRDCYDGPVGTADIGACKAGTQECVQGGWGACEGQILPEEKEICGEDPEDENCNGTEEEGCGCPEGSVELCYGGPAGTEGVGVCGGGTKTCSEGVWGECQGQILPTGEVCDLKDNDCDGDTDEDAEGTGVPCDTGLLGECAPGTTYCKEGVAGIACVKNQAPMEETCDGHDNNCDGANDNLEFEGCQMVIPGSDKMCAGSFKCAGSLPACSPFFYFFDNFSVQNANWVKGPEWEIGPMPAMIMPPGQGNPDPAQDFSGGNDNSLAGVKLGGNAGQLIHGMYYLTSKAINTAEAPTLYLSYARWLNAAPNNKTPHVVEVSSNGTDFTTIWTNGDDTIFDNAWKVIALDVSTFKSPTFKVRFGFAMSDLVALASISSWNIDDVGLSSCPPPGVNP